VAECPDAVPACAPYLKPRSAPGFRGKSSTLVERWIAHGLPVLLQPWADRKGFHQPLARRLDEQFIEEREAERDRGLREGVYRLPSSQDSKELVARGHMIMPAFFVEKATRKEVSSTLLAYRGRKPFCRISLGCESSHRN